jgi:hypothetical protein
LNRFNFKYAKATRKNSLGDILRNHSFGVRIWLYGKSSDHQGAVQFCEYQTLISAMLILALNLCSHSALASVPQAKDAEDPERSAAKERYWLFDPVPETHLRSFHPDRPGSTNTPYTVDAGHVQLELELVNYSEQPSALVKNKNLNYPNPNFRLGVSNSIEVDVAFVPYVSQSDASGIGDLRLRGHSCRA